MAARRRVRRNLQAKRCEEAPRNFDRALAIDLGNGDANYDYGVLTAVTGRAAAACELLPRVVGKP